MARVDRIRAFALAMTLLIIALITVVTFMAVNVANLDSRTVTQQVQGARALYAARAGIAMAMSNLTGLRDPSWGTTEVQVVLEPDQLFFRVKVEPHPHNTTPPLRSQLAWMVTSTGLVGSPPNQVRRTLQAYVQQEPFSRYAYFTNQDLGANNTVIRFVDHDQITGPTHTNGFFTFAGHPKFSETVRSANLGPDPSQPMLGKDPYYTPATEDQPARYTSPGNGSTTDPALFYHCENDGRYAANGPVALEGSTRFSMAGGQPYIPLPVDNGAILSSARENGTVIDAPTVSNPGPSNYTLPQNRSANYAISYDENTGRITGYTRNGASISAADAPPVFELRFTTGGAAVYRWDPVAGSYRAWSVSSRAYASDPGSPSVLDTTAQTLYVEGTCLLRGTVRGRTTLGVQYDAHLTDNLVYANLSSDVLGIVANQSIVLQSPTNLRRDRTVHATMMALKGSFTVNKYDLGTNRGVLHLFGGIIQRVRGAVGTGTASTVSTGYAKDYVYDEKLVFRPPLNFPNTPNVYIVNLRDFGAVGSL